MKLIAETNFDNVNVDIQEAADGKGKNYFIEGIFMQGGIKNRNGRMYPMETLDNFNLFLEFSNTISVTGSRAENL